MNLVTFLANASEFVDMAYGDKMMLGLIVTAIGILMVFVILTLIILSIYLMNFVLDKIVPVIADKLHFKKKGKKAEKAEKTENADMPIEVVPTIEVDDTKVVAAITAAVYQMLEEENDGRKPNISFRISSIKKI